MNNEIKQKGLTRKELLDPDTFSVDSRSRDDTADTKAGDQELLTRREFIRRSLALGAGLALEDGLSRLGVGLPTSTESKDKETIDNNLQSYQTRILHEHSKLDREQEKEKKLPYGKAALVGIAAAAMQDDNKTKKAAEWIKGNPGKAILAVGGAAVMISGVACDVDESTVPVEVTPTPGGITAPTESLSTQPPVVETDASSEPTESQQGNLTEEQERVLLSLKTLDEWVRVQNGENLETTSIYQDIIKRDPDDPVRERALNLIEVMTAGGDVVDFSGRAIARHWGQNPDYPESAVNKDQWVIEVDGTQNPDEDTGKVYVFNWVGEGAESDPDAVMAADPQRAAVLGRLTFTPDEGESIVRTITQEVTNDGQTIEYISVASVDPESGNRSKWTDLSGTTWIDPETDPNTVTLEDGEESLFYRLDNIQGQEENQEELIYFEGRPLPGRPEGAEDLKLDQETTEDGEDTALLVEEAEEGELNTKYRLTANEETGERKWTEVEGIDATELLAKCEKVISINAPLVGSVRMWEEGEDGFYYYNEHQINFPNINVPIDIGLHKSDMVWDGVDTPVTDIYLNEELDQQYGEGYAERQLTFSVLRMLHFKYEKQLLDSDKDETPLEFMQWLEKIDQGEIDFTITDRAILNNEDEMESSKDVEIKPFNDLTYIFAEDIEEFAGDRGDLSLYAFGRSKNGGLITVLNEGANLQESISAQPEPPLEELPDRYRRVPYQSILNSISYFSIPYDIRYYAMRGMNLPTGTSQEVNNLIRDGKLLFEPYWRIQGLTLEENIDEIADIFNNSASLQGDLTWIEFEG